VNQAAFLLDITDFTANYYDFLTVARQFSKSWHWATEPCLTLYSFS